MLKIYAHVIPRSQRDSMERIASGQLEEMFRLEHRRELNALK
jgi:hypothetical protein